MTEAQYDRKLAAITNKILEAEYKLLTLKEDRKTLRLENPNRRVRNRKPVSVCNSGF